MVIDALQKSVSNIGICIKLNIHFFQWQYSAVYMGCSSITFKSLLKVNLLSITGGRKLTDTVRKIMRKLATNKVWSMVSFRGRKGKLPFAELRTCRIIFSEYYKDWIK